MFVSQVSQVDVKNFFESTCGEVGLLNISLWDIIFVRVMHIME